MLVLINTKNTYLYTLTFEILYYKDSLVKAAVALFIFKSLRIISFEKGWAFSGYYFRYFQLDLTKMKLSLYIYIYTGNSLGVLRVRAHTTRNVNIKIPSRLQFDKFALNYYRFFVFRNHRQLLFALSTI